MSRIHEALKKAEQERAASQGNQLDSMPAGEMPSEPSPVFQSTPSMENVGTMPMGAMPTFSTQVSADTFLARCAQGNWNPDPKTMLFVGGDEQKTALRNFDVAVSALRNARKRIAEEVADHQRPAERRKVSRRCEPGAGSGAPTWTPRASHRRRFARPAASPGVRNRIVPRSRKSSYR